MSGPIESAGELLATLYAGFCRVAPSTALIELIEARDNAVRLALLDELERAVIDDHAPTIGGAYSSAVGQLAYKYGAK